MALAYHRRFAPALSEGNKELEYYYPTSDLVTGPDILFFWVARMIMAGYEFQGKKPFENVYLTGIVRDNQGRKMSKTLGNSPDPLLLIDKCGADGVRMGLIMSAPLGTISSSTNHSASRVVTSVIRSGTPSAS